MYHNRGGFKLREYTDSEVIKLLQNNPKLSFLDENGDAALVGENGYIMHEFYNNGHSVLKFTTHKRRWKLLQNPRSFFDIADEKLSTKRVKVVHSYLKLDKVTQAKLTMDTKVMRNKIVNGEYLFLANLLEILSNLLNSEEVAEILKYGEWYVEE